MVSLSKGIEETRLRQQSQPLLPALLIFALLGPLFHLMGVLTRGVSMLYGEYPRLVAIYGLVALSGMAAAYLAMRPGSARVRIVAGLALLVSLGSVAYVGSLWRRDVERGRVQVAMVPVEQGKVGIVVAPASQRMAAVAEAYVMEDTIGALLRQMGFDGEISIRRAYPVASEEQAIRVANRLHAQVIVWQTEQGSDAAQVTRYVTVLGANPRTVTLDPPMLMSLMGTQGTFRIEGARRPDETSVSASATRVLAPFAAGFAVLALDEPVAAAGYFESILRDPNLPTAVQRTVHNDMGTAFLLAGRPDLAREQFQAALELLPDADAWVGLGNVSLFAESWPEAAAAYEQALALDPYHAAAHCGLGLVRGHSYEVARSIACLERAVALRPDWGIPRALLGLVYELSGNLDAAQGAYQASMLRAAPFEQLAQAALQRIELLAADPPTPVPTATPLPTPTATPVPEMGVYRVQRGDTLQLIADKLGTTIEELAEVNQLENVHSVTEGQLLIIPDER